MKRTIKIMFILLYGINGFGNDSIPSISELRKNEIQLSLAAFSHNDDVYHTFGYSRLFRLKRNAYLGFYGGVGYLPKNNDFFYKLGFTGYKLYAYTGRLQFVLKFRKTFGFLPFPPHSGLQLSSEAAFAFSRWPPLALADP